jgi:hypothetical protein
MELEMKARYWATAAFVLAFGAAAQAQAATVIPFYFIGGAGGYTVFGTMTVAPNVSPADPDPTCGTDGSPCRSDPASAYKILGITGSFSDVADGVSDAAITGLIPISPAIPHDSPVDPLVPTSLSFVDYSGGSFSYDNLYFPHGSVVDCSTFPFTGTIIDDFGVAFTADGGYTVNVWGDGDLHGPGTSAYGITVLRDSNLLSTSFDGLSGGLVPEPSTWALMLLAFGGLGSTLRYRRGRQIVATTTV